MEYEANNGIIYFVVGMKAVLKIECWALASAQHSSFLTQSPTHILTHVKAPFASLIQNVAASRL